MSGELSVQLGKFLLILGIAIAAIGIALMIGSRLHSLGLGHLPGDITYRAKNGSFYFPIVTCLVVSAIVTLILWGISFLAKR